MKIAGIYKITHIDTNRSYIGKSKDIASRLRYHKRESSWTSDKDKNKHLYLSFMKYGIERFSFETIWECPKKVVDIDDTLNKVERFFIEKFNALDKGFNKTSGGDGVRNYKWSEARIASHAKRMKENHPMKGKTQTDYAKQMCAETHTGRFHSNEERAKRRASIEKHPNGYNKKQVWCYFADNMELYKIFNSLEEAVVETKTAKPNISKCCNGERVRAGSLNNRKLTWRFSEQSNELL